MITLSGNALLAADTNFDGSVSAYDSLRVQQYINGVINEFY